MIKNERQYQLASDQVATLRRTLHELEARPQSAAEHPKRNQIELSAVKGQLDELSRELEEYRQVREGVTPVGPVRDLSAVPRETLEWLDAAIADATEYEYEQRLNAVDVLRHLRAIRQALVS